ncbi:DUF2397 domain-containing protein [Nocardiopsis coralliicola]
MYSYLTAPERRTYLAVMRLFTGTLLADLGAGEVAAGLAEAERRGAIDPGESRTETVADRLEALARWGNLVPGRREPAATIAEFTRSRVRYQVSKLAVRVQRDVDGLLEVADGAREVSRELLPAIAEGLDAVAAALGRRDTDTLARAVTTLFLQHGEFAAAVRDFYAYLGSVIARYDLAPDEAAGFKHMLLEYVDLIAQDVLRHAEGIADRLAALEPQLPALLALIDAGPDTPALAAAGAAGRDAVAPGQTALMERAPGRAAADWAGLSGWFVGRPGRPSEVDALREATSRAISALLGTVKRFTGSGGVDPGRRRDLLDLAARFDGADPGAAHDLYAASFGLYPSRHLGLAVDGAAEAPSLDWAEAAGAEVEVNVRSKGERAASGPVPRLGDDPLGRAALLEEEAQRAQRRAAAVRELAAAAGDLRGARLSADALGLFCELLTLAGASRDTPAESGTAADPVSGLTLAVRPSPGTGRIGSVFGTLELHGSDVELTVAGEAG